MGLWEDSSKTIAESGGKDHLVRQHRRAVDFLEEMYPGYGNLVARDMAAREVLRMCELGLGVGGGMQVYLDMSHLPAKTASQSRICTQLHSEVYR